MPWYKAGTVSVVQNSNAVTGTGTAFIANSRVGDAFLGPDGCWYEVTNIASDTAMAISPNYLGVTSSAGTYAVVPIQGYPKALADAFNGLNNEFGATLAALGTTGNYDILPMSKGGTEASNAEDSRTNLGLGKVATENILPIEKGGTGATTDVSALEALGGVRLGAANASAGTAFCSGAPPGIAEISSSGNDSNTALRIANDGNNGASSVMTFIRDGSFAVHVGIDTDNKFKLGGFSMGAVARTFFHEGNAVGTVSQSGGIPTGAIIESGSTGNGSYIKYLDGTMICRHGIALSSLPPNAAVAAAWYFPAAFIGQPTCVTAAGSVTGNGGFLNAAQDVAGTGTQTAIAVGNSHPSATISSPYVHLIAIGRWF
ncbi:MAG: phage tail protein [Oxalobacteraceae bacterium]|nr:MAG: phage tail protein [Oxalobacteraceae bacterium]